MAALAAMLVGCGAARAARLDASGPSANHGAIAAPSQQPAEHARRTGGVEGSAQDASAPAAGATDDSRRSGDATERSGGGEAGTRSDSVRPASGAVGAEAAGGSAGTGAASARNPCDLGPPVELQARRLAAGRSRVQIAMPPGERFVTLGVLGEPATLLGFDVSGPPSVGRLGAHESLGADGALPRFVAFAVDGAGGMLDVVVDAQAPTELVFWWADPNDRSAPSPKALREGQAVPRPLVGLPLPTDSRDGYTIETPERYAFLRLDVAVAVRAAMRQTHIRFRRNPIALGHASQWDGAAPGTDVGKSVHIGHRGGREIDVGLPSSDESPSVITRRCEGVLVERAVLRCAPGTVKDVDALRLAYFLGLLVDGPTPNGIHMPKGRPGPIALLDSILTDEAYIDEIRRAARELRRKNWIHDEGYAALMEEGILRPSAWHTDHVHLRFGGEDARPAIGVPAPGSNAAASP